MYDWIVSLLPFPVLNGDAVTGEQAPQHLVNKKSQYINLNHIPSVSPAGQSEHSESSKSSSSGISESSDSPIYSLVLIVTPVGSSGSKLNNKSVLFYGNSTVFWVP
jgi:hypothetical protein